MGEGDTTIEVAVAVADEHAAGWIELTLAATTGIRVTLARGEILHGARPFAALVVDVDDPGPGFLPFYRRLRLVQPEVWMLALGNEDAPVLRAVEWDVARAVLLPKPYRLEEVRDAFGWLRGRMLGAIATDGGADGLPNAASAGAARARPADLLQMFCINLWTGKVELMVSGSTGTSQRGTLFLEAGTLVHAVAAGMEGESACRQVLRWGDCEFTALAEVSPPRRTIVRGWEEVMLGTTSPN